MRIGLNSAIIMNPNDSFGLDRQTVKSGELLEYSALGVQHC